MWDGYFTLGGNEVGNSARTIGYTSTAECPVGWIRSIDCGGIQPTVGDEDYLYANITEAPWYDSDDPLTSARFFGLYVVDISGLSDSTRSAVITQKITDGAQVSGYRHASREVRVRALLTARGMDALEYGMTWLRSVLEPNACGVHGGDCGSADFQFFVDCPPPWNGVQPIEEYQEEQSRLRRVLHNVTCVSGPLIQQELSSSDGTHFGYIVEFTLVAAVPFVYGATRAIETPPTPPTVIQDVVFNLMKWPSATLTSGSVVFATNLSTNPSVETNNTGWTLVADGALITSGAMTSARSTDVASVGTASQRARWTAPNSNAGTASAYMGSKQEVPLLAGDRWRYSINMWSTSNVESGTAVLGDLEINALWRSSSGGGLILNQSLGIMPASGGAITVASIAPPAGANFVEVRSQQRVTSWSTGAIVRNYVDALAITVP
jgi:hypothetical protein